MRNQHKIEKKTEGILCFDRLVSKHIYEMSSGNGNTHFYLEMGHKTYMFPNTLFSITFESL